MMKLLKGQAPIPDKKISVLCKVLALDDLAKAELKDAIIMDTIDEKLKAFPGGKVREKPLATNYDEFPQKHFTVLEHWYELPILDYLTCDIEDRNPKGISKRLGLTEYEVERSLEKMKALGLADFQSGQWVKTHNKIRFPTSLPAEVTRNYYNQVLKKVSDELSNSKPERFSRRSITNISIAVNPSKVQAAKEKLQQCLYEITSDLSADSAEEVYFLTACLFPVGKDQAGN